ncbi:MAG: hypothetical protein P4L83_21935 [Nevskia sp.]|nr:hypothetical protein [Nevskia sp.]
MKRAAVLLFVALLLGSCAHDDPKAPCKHPSLALFATDCGPLGPINR